MQNFSYENEFYMQCFLNWYIRMVLDVDFEMELESQGNSEMTYWKQSAAVSSLIEFQENWANSKLILMQGC